jgi:hypothetical protein
VRLVFNPLSGNFDYVSDSGEFIALDGSSTTTYPIPFAQGASFYRSESFGLKLYAGSGAAPDMLAPHTVTTGDWSFDPDYFGEIDNRAMLYIQNGSVSTPYPTAVGIRIVAGGSGIGSSYIPGNLTLSAAAGVLAGQNGGGISLTAGASNAGGKGGDITLSATSGAIRGGDIVLSTTSTGDSSGMVIIGASSDVVPAGLRGDYAFYCAGKIYSDNLSASTMVKADSNKGLVAATPDVDFVTPTSVPHFTYFV